MQHGQSHCTFTFPPVIYMKIYASFRIPQFTTRLSGGALFSRFYFGNSFACTLNEINSYGAFEVRLRKPPELFDFSPSIFACIEKQVDNP